MYSPAPRRPRKHLPCTARDFIIPPFLCLVLPGAQRRAAENCESSTFAVICCPYTKIRGRERWFSLAHTCPLPYFLTQEEGTCTEWTAHNCLGAAQITFGSHHLNREQACKGEQKCSPQIFILLENPCIIKMNTLLQ